MTHCCTPTLPHHRLQQRAGVPHHAGQASLKIYTLSWCLITQRKDSLFSAVSGGIFPVQFHAGCPLTSVFDWVCVCVGIHVSCVCLLLCVTFQGEDQNKPDIFKQLASVQLCGIASHVVCLVNQLRWGFSAVAPVHFAYILFFFFPSSSSFTAA